MTGYKTGMNITKFKKKLNTTEHKTDMNITKIEKYKKDINISEKVNTTFTTEHYTTKLW